MSAQMVSATVTCSSMAGELSTATTGVTHGGKWPGDAAGAASEFQDRGARAHRIVNQLRLVAGRQRKVDSDGVPILSNFADLAKAPTHAATLSVACYRR
jgi:hypothetical protein